MLGQNIKAGPRWSRVAYIRAAMKEESALEREEVREGEEEGKLCNQQTNKQLSQGPPLSHNTMVIGSGAQARPPVEE